jgi:hypothetical protein
MYSHTVLSAILPPFLCTAAVRKIIVTLFLKQDNILMAWTYRLCMCMWCVCVCVSWVLFIIFIVWFFLTKRMYHWTVVGIPLVVCVPHFEKPCFSGCHHLFSPLICWLHTHISVSMPENIAGNNFPFLIVLSLSRRFLISGTWARWLKPNQASSKLFQCWYFFLAKNHFTKGAVW